MPNIAVFCSSRTSWLPGILLLLLLLLLYLVKSLLLYSKLCVNMKNFCIIQLICICFFSKCGTFPLLFLSHCFSYHIVFVSFFSCFVFLYFYCFLCLISVFVLLSPHVNKYPFNRTEVRQFRFVLSHAFSPWYVSS